MRSYLPSFLKRLIPLVLLPAVLAIPALSATNALGPIPKQYTEIARRFADNFPDEHITRQELDDSVSRRAWTNYLSALDYDRLYFLASDIDELRKDDTRLDDALRKGDLKFASRVYELFKQRVRETLAGVKPTVEKGFDLTVDETYHWKRRKLPWPADEAARAETWRLRLKNEYVQQLISREMDDEENGDDDADAPGADEPPGGDEPDEDADGADEQPGTSVEPLGTPEETIIKRYEQFLTRLEDNDAEWVLQIYLSAFAHAYDPHSAYMTRSASEDFAIEMKLSLVGIGALLRAEDGAAKIVRLIPGGPAKRDTREERLRPGDRIIGVGQDDDQIVDTLHWPLYKVVRLIRGEKGTRVVLRVIPASDPSGAKLKLVDLVRDKVKLEEQAVKSETREIPASDGTAVKLGVIDVPTFYANMQASLLASRDARRCSTDVRKLIDELEDEQVDGLLLDLRSNGGGSLLEAIRMTGYFITAGPVVQVKEMRRLRILPDMDSSVEYNGPLVVLVNRLSASASEILSAALQDYGRAVIVGDSRTHGKGTVQTILPLGRNRDLGTVKVTVSSFYRISGKPTQKIGVTPDVVVASAFDTMEIGEDTLPNALEESVIRPALYYPAGNVARWTPELARRSRERRAADPRYVAYEKMLARARALNETKAVPLRLEARHEMTKAEKALEDLQQAADPDASEEDNGKRPDLVLEEALNILGDLVELSRKAESRAAEREQASASPSRSTPFAGDILNWLRSRP